MEAKHKEEVAAVRQEGVDLLASAEARHASLSLHGYHAQRTLPFPLGPYCRPMPRVLGGS